MREIDNPVSPCDNPCDVAIPPVYPNQPILIPTAEVARQIPFEIDVRETLRQTFTDPDSDPPLSIQSATASGPKVLGLGHAGIAVINGLTGAVKYAEYGRYDRAGFGEVRFIPEVAGVTVTFTEGGNPNPASMAALGRELVRTNGVGRAVEGVWVKLANGAFDTMVSFVGTRMANVAAGRDAGRADAYDVSANHCVTFALEVARSAGVNTNVSGAPDLDIVIVGGNMSTRLALRTFSPTFEVPARQINVMQERYRDYRLSSAGALIGNEQFPTTLNGL
ncbi:hypothetical protein [Jannaschia pohangensis]|uniref:Type VI secretion system effector TseH-like domain-containing protein n=1 Tax=Jannaschia pohangensis TaxID=390807 RepID=A0A1I3GVB4_9RHOB|nr:hypothetical protein [Jannaschia pohangensis]SFI27301.1 hypothetical protein SAMN04488095_0343 [Jannaschia pohangensis]